MITQSTDEAPQSASARHYIGATLMVAASTFAGLLLEPRLGGSAVDMLYLPAVLTAAILGGRWPGLLAAAASVLAYNYFFTEPRHTLRVDNAADLATVIVLLGVAIVTSQLATSVRRQAVIAAREASRNATVAGLARRLLGCTSEQEVLDVTTQELASIFESNVVVVGGGQPARGLASAPGPVALTPGDLAIATLVLESGERAGRGLDRALPVEWQFHPIRSAGGVVAAVGLARDDGASAVRAERFALLDNLLDQVALALERGRLELETREFARVRERDKLRSALLATIGQDLQPSLSAIGRGVRELRREGVSDKVLLSDLGAETAKLERYLLNLAGLGVEDDRAAVVAGDLSVDLFRREVIREGAPVHLTPKEYAVLAELAKQPGRVVSHAHLLRAVWGPAQENNADYLRVAIRSLRQKLERDPKKPALILNEPAVGYRLCAECGG